MSEAARHYHLHSSRLLSSSLLVTTPSPRRRHHRVIVEDQNSVDRRHSRDTIASFNNADGASTSSNAGEQQQHRSLLTLINLMIMPPTISMAIMGAKGCGKTSIVNQFLYCQYTTNYHSTSRTTLYQSHVVLEDRIYELHLYDCPAISTDTFVDPCSNLLLLDQHQHGTSDGDEGEPQDVIVDAARLRSVCRANAYVLVFDLTLPSTFDYIRTLRSIIMRRHVAAVKAAAAAASAAPSATAQTHHQDQFGQSSSNAVASASTTTTTTPSTNTILRHAPPIIIVLGAKLDNCQRATNHMSSTTANMDSTGQQRTNRFRREVTKQWKVPYMEVSARYNCNVFNAFKTLAKEVDSQQNGRKTAERLLDNVRRKQCIIC